MIYTVTFNPSIDYIVSVEELKLGRTNRTSSEKTLPGGKGINVSTVLTNLGIENTALGFLAGFTGDEIERELTSLNINCDFIKLQNGISRINLKVKNIDGMEINGQGPDIDEASVNLLLDKISNIKSGDILVLAGSIPSSMPNDIYSQILEMVCKKGVLTVVDATGELLKNTLKYNPFLIKPNNYELGNLFGEELYTEEEMLHYAKKLQELGARNVLVSRAGDGAILLDENGEVYSHEAPKGKLVNAVGAGDSMVAGFIAGYLKTGKYEDAFLTGLAAGSASAFSENLATKGEIEAILSSLKNN